MDSSNDSGHVPTKRRGLAAVVAIVWIGMFGAVSPPAISAAEPLGTVSISESPEPAVGQPVSITVSGTSSQAGGLAVYMLDSSPVAPGASCPSAQHKEEVNLGDIAPPTPVSAGSYSQTYSFTPGSAGIYVICGYLYDPSNNDAIYAFGNGSFTAKYGVTVSKWSGNPTPSPPPQPTAVYPANGGTVTYADRRLVFAWSGGYLSDAVLVFRRAPVPGAAPFRTLEVLPDEAAYGDANVPFVAGQEKAVLGDTLLVGQYFWQVQADGNGAVPFITSPVFSFTVVAPVLSRLRVRSRSVYGVSVARPGTSWLGIDTTPYATLFVTVRHAGRVVERTTYPSDPGAVATFRYPWRCSRAGATTYKVIAHDAYGHVMTRSGRWTVPTCAAVVAHARRLAHHRNGEGTGGEGGNSGTCSSSGIVFTWTDASCATAERLWRTYGTNGVTPTGWYCSGDRYSGGCDTPGALLSVLGAEEVTWHQQ